MASMDKTRVSVAGRFTRYASMLSKDFGRNRQLYLLALPVILYYIIFHYVPMYGITLAFKDFSPMMGILGSPWIGFRHFSDFLQSHHFVRVVKNTFLLSIYNSFWGFPAPIVLALLLNEVRVSWFKRLVQTVAYMPHFISIMVISGIIINFVGNEGLITEIVVMLGGKRGNLLLRPELFRTIYVSSGIWQNVGWGTIIYLAALSRVDPELYEACRIDGGGRWIQTLYITLPGIAPTIIILLILDIGRTMSVGFEKVFLLYNPVIYGTADVISTFIYRRGLLEAAYSYSTAVGLFNTLINFSLLYAANRLSRRVSETSLW